MPKAFLNNTKRKLNLPEHKNLEIIKEGLNYAMFLCATILLSKPLLNFN